MKAIYLYVIGALIIVGAAVTPLIVQQNFTKILNSKKDILSKQGLELNIKDEKGYIDGKTSFILRVVDGKKFRDYMLSKMVTVNPDFIYMSKMLKKRSEKDIGLVLNGTTFDGLIRHSNLYLTNTKIELSLVRLSDKIMSNMDKNIEVKNVIDPILKEKVLTFIVDVNSKQKITQIKTKDIDRTIKLKNGKTLDFKLTGNKATIDSGKRIVGAYTFDNQLLKINSGYENLLFQIQGFDYKFDYLNQFNSIGDVHIDSFEFSSKGRRKNIIFKSKNLDVKSAVKSDTNDTVAINISYVINDMYIKSQRKDLSLDKVKLDIEVLGVLKQDLMDVSKTYNQITLSGKQISRKDIKAISDSFLNIVNKGFKININLSLTGLKDTTLMLNDIKVVLHSKLKPNIANMGISSIAKLANALSVEGSVTMDEQDLKMISSKNRKFSRFAKLAKKEANKAIFDIEFKKGKLLVNKKHL